MIVKGKEVIKLEFPIKINGILTDQLTMRRPKLKDFRNASQLAGKDAEEQEIRLFSTLADCAINDLEELDYADYGKLQDVFRRMVKGSIRSEQNPE